MKSREDIEKHLNTFYAVDKDTIKALIYTLEEIVEAATISEELVRSLEIAERDIQVLHNKYKWRLLDLAKKGWVLD